jgi:hypothetical protein
MTEIPKIIYAYRRAGQSGGGIQCSVNSALGSPFHSYKTPFIRKDIADELAIALEAILKGPHGDGAEFRFHKESLLGQAFNALQLYKEIK